MHEMLCRRANKNKIWPSPGLTSPKRAPKSWKSRRKQDPDMQAKRSLASPPQQPQVSVLGSHSAAVGPRDGNLNLQSLHPDVVSPRELPKHSVLTATIPLLHLSHTRLDKHCVAAQQQKKRGTGHSAEGIIINSGGIFGAAATSPTNNRPSGDAIRDSPQQRSSDICKCYSTCMEKSSIGGRLSACLPDHPNHVPTLDLPFLASRQLQQKLEWTDNGTCETEHVASSTKRSPK